MNKIFTLTTNFLIILFIGIGTLPMMGNDSCDGYTFVEKDECATQAMSLVLQCPPDQTAYCTDEIWDLSIYGNATYYAYGNWYDAGYPVVSYNLNGCNVGTITRTWTVEDYNWNIYTCTQTITVLPNGGSFGYDDITWPQEHVDLEGCYPSTHPSQLPPGMGYPTWYYYNECSSIGVTFSDQVFNFGPTCKKIVRKWRVIDWCVYNPNNNNGYNTPGEFTYYQFIKISKGDIPVLVCPPDITVNSYNCQTAYVNVPPLNVDGELCGGDYIVTNNSPYADSNGANISGTYPVGWHWVKYTVEYGCGKKKTCTRKIKVTDKKPPTPYCYGSITVALMPVDEDGDGIPEDGMVEIWAKDLDKGSTASCNNYDMLQFSFSSDPTDNVKVFTCADVGANEVEMWITDSDGNQSFCVVTVNVQNNNANIPDCEPEEDDEEEDDEEEEEEEDDDGGDTGSDGYTYYIGGQVSTVDGTMMDSVKVTIVDQGLDTSFIVTLDTTVVLVTDSIFNDMTGEYMYTVSLDTTITANMDTIVSNFILNAYTNLWGHYRFAGFALPGDQYELTAMYNGTDYNSGINEADLHFLMDYVVGNAEFTEPHQKIAADIDRNGIVDLDDLRLLLDYLTGEIDDFGVVSEWIFVDSEQLENESAEEVYDNPDLIIDILIDSTNIDDANFTGIRLGDIIIDNSVGGILAGKDMTSLSQKIANQSDEATIEIIKRGLENTQPSVHVFPNPFESYFNLDLNGFTSETLHITLLDAKGSVIYDQEHTVEAGNATLKIVPVQNYTGILIYRIIEDGKIYSGKMMKL